MLIMKRTITLALLFAVGSLLTSQAQTEITNAFDDLKRQGTVSEENSVMRQTAPAEALGALLAENPAAGFFCFTEDRLHDIRLKDAIPARWTERPAASRTQFASNCAPGEYYVWQIGVYAPYKALDKLAVTFSDLRNERGAKIPASALTCFNLGGTDEYGRPFSKQVDVPQGGVQALWIGTDVPATATGTYKGTVTVRADGTPAVTINVELTVQGAVIANHGDNEGWRKSRLRWLNATVGENTEPTAPYTPVEFRNNTVSWLGGALKIDATGLPAAITTFYDQSNRIDRNIDNQVLAAPMQFVIETSEGIRETLKPGSVQITSHTHAAVAWKVVNKSRNFELTVTASMGFDGLAEYAIAVKPLREVAVTDIRLEVPYTAYAATYMMGLGHRGGYRPDSLITWNWDVRKHQDKIWMGNINAGLNFCFKDENYVRPLVNIYYNLGKLNLPVSWGNQNKGGVNIGKTENGRVLMSAYSGERSLAKGQSLHYNFSMLVTPVKPINLELQATARFYHSNSDLSSAYIPAAQEAGANMINVHHKKDIYPFINYPYADESSADLKAFIDEAHAKDLKVRAYYTTREVTVKLPELWALRSLGSEVIHDGAGKDARTLIHGNGPHEWLSKNLVDHFIPAWYNAFKEGKYAGDMDLSVITTPDSRWNNYFLAGLDWMVRNIGLDGIYIDDSALDHQTLQRARRVLDADGRQRLIDIHSWNHMNEWAGYANSLHLYLELLPYVDKTWIGEGFDEFNTPDFWLVEMSGIPFGLMSETLEARNMFRGMVFGMLPRLPWSGNPVPLWQLWDDFGMKDAEMRGYWDPRCPVRTGNDNLPATVYINGDKALVAIANWTDMPQKAKITIDEELLGFKPSKASLPEVRNMQWGSQLPFRYLLARPVDVMGRNGMLILLEK